MPTVTVITVSVSTQPPDIQRKIPKLFGEKEIIHYLCAQNT
jgi:hypothetical protein